MQFHVLLEHFKGQQKDKKEEMRFKKRLKEKEKKGGFQPKGWAFQALNTNLYWIQTRPQTWPHFQRRVNPSSPRTGCRRAPPPCARVTSLACCCRAGWSLVHSATPWHRGGDPSSWWTGGGRSETCKRNGCLTSWSTTKVFLRQDPARPGPGNCFVTSTTRSTEQVSCAEWNSCSRPHNMSILQQVWSVE